MTKFLMKFGNLLQKYDKYYRFYNRGAGILQEYDSREC